MDDKYLYDSFVDNVANKCDCISLRELLTIILNEKIWIDFQILVKWLIEYGYLEKLNEEEELNEADFVVTKNAEEKGILKTEIKIIQTAYGKKILPFVAVTGKGQIVITEALRDLYV